jgi:hypothetical protein
VPAAPNPVVGGYAGAAPGAYVYVAEDDGYGKITQTQPSTDGDATTVIGIALCADTVQFFLNARPDSTA